MSAEISQLESDSEDGKMEHRKQLEKAAQLTSVEIKDGVAVWEVIREAYQSEEVRLELHGTYY